jgi:hypothetical protein
LAVGYTHSLSPSLLNDFRFSYARQDFEIKPTVENFPTLFLDDTTVRFSSGIFIPREFVFNNYNITDTLTLIRGRHTVKAGFEMRRILEDSDYQLETQGFYEFQSIFTFANDLPYYLEGLVDPNTGRFVGTPRHFRHTQWGLFVQDDWKIHPRLTLNLGLRYDLFGAPTEKDGILSNITLGSGSDFATRIATATVGRVDKVFNEDYNNLAPRIGLAWDPWGDGKMAVRAAYSVAYLEPYSNLYTNASRFDPPDSTFPAAFPLFDGSIITFSVPATPSPSFASGLSPSGGIPGVRIAVSGTDVDIRSAYSQQWFLGVQRNLFSDCYVDVNYVGTAGRKLYVREDYNRFVGDGLDGYDFLNPEWGAGITPGMFFVTNDNSSIYHGMNVQVRKAMSRGYTFTANYTWSHSIDIVSGPGLADFSNIGTALYTGVQDIGNRRADRGSSEFDVRHRLSITGLWDLPKTEPGGVLAKGLLNGWQLNGTASFQTGRPFSVLCTQSFLFGCDYNADSNPHNRLNTPSFGNDIRGVSNSDWPNGIFTAADFPVPAFGTNGNLGRNTFSGPGFAQIDFSVFKNTQVGERFNIQFRAEFFNLFNRSNFWLPVNVIQSPFFGRSIAAHPSRTMQFVLKFIF